MTSVVVGSPNTEASTEMSEASLANVERFYYMDNLRAFALLAGIFFHVGLGFTWLLHEVWPITDTQTSIGLDYILWFVHTFRMPLFFLLAGFFAHYMVKRRGLKGFVKNRIFRIAIPFVIFWPLITASLFGIFIYVAKNMAVDTPIIQMVRLAMENPEAMNGKKPPISTTHLWFLYYLFQFCMLAALCSKFVPSGRWLEKLLANPVMLFVGLPVLTAVSVLHKYIPHPAAESFMPELWAYLFYGPFFVVGWVLHKNPVDYFKMQKYWPILVAVGLICFIVFSSQLNQPLTLAEAMRMKENGIDLTASQYVLAMCTGLLAWSMSFLFLFLGKLYFNQSNPIMRYIADGSYWVYIVHVPIVFYLQAYFHTVNWPIAVELCLMLAMTLGSGYLSYALLVRRTPIGWLLNGRKKNVQQQ